MSSREEVEQAVAQTLGHYGAIDVLVNNAGNIGPVGRVWDNDPEDWARTIAVHLMGVFYLAATRFSPQCWSGDRAA